MSSAKLSGSRNLGTFMGHQPEFRILIKKVRESETSGLQSVKNERFFHGFVAQAQTGNILKDKGDFLVRQALQSECKKHDTDFEQFIISVRTEGPDKSVMGKQTLCCTSKQTANSLAEGKSTSIQVDGSLNNDDRGIKHFFINHSRRERLYYIKDFGFDHVSGLVDYHLRKKQPLDNEGTLLLTPVIRPTWQLNHEQVKKICCIGNGAFGEVWSGEMRTGIFKKRQVAIKLIAGSMTVSDNESLFEEAMLMQSFVHPNVIRLYGVAANESPIMIVMELAEKNSVLDAVSSSRLKREKEGSLTSHVRNGRKHILIDYEREPTILLRMKLCLGAARGLAYISSKNVIHRDIAARNVLITKGYQAKISDFGLGVRAKERREKRLNKVPVRYLAPETLKNGSYTAKTDIWSFGVFLWEVFHDGLEPYYYIEELSNVAKRVKRGETLVNSAKEYPEELWHLTKRCFSFNPENRPIASGCVDVIVLALGKKYDR